ncbi:MAG: Endoribonuclease YbeY [Chlamydiales bacterium]|nr:Endoribonuclease YbeY [Chlamydiales bacterium]
MKVLVFNQQDDLAIRVDSVKPVIQHLLTQEKRATDEVAVYFVSTQEISHLHQEFFNDSTTTDCISFPLDQEEETGYHVLGEIFICPMTALDFVQKTGGDCYQELTLYLVHGMLHLIGYDDIEENKRLEMRAAEARNMEPLIRQKLLLRG